MEVYAVQHPENISSHTCIVQEMKSDINDGYETEILFRNSIMHIHGYHPPQPIYIHSKPPCGMPVMHIMYLPFFLVITFFLRIELPKIFIYGI